jgi:integrase
MPVQDLWHLKNPAPDATPCGEHGKLVASGRHNSGKRYRVNFTDQTGKPDTRAFHLEKEAKAFDLKVRSEVSRGEYIDPASGKILLKAYAESWEAAQRFDPSTREAVRMRLANHVYPSIGDRELRVLSQRPSIIQAWLKGLEATLATGTMRNIFVNVSAIFSAAQDDGLILRNPCSAKSVTRPTPVKRKVRPWTGERVADVRAGLPARYAATADLGAGAGLLLAAALGLSPDDMEFLHHNIHVCRQIKQVYGKLVFAPPKGGKERDVPLGDELALRVAASLQRWPAVAVTLPWLEPDGPPVTVRLIFTGRLQGRPVNRNSFNVNAWKPALVAAGVTDPGRDQGFHQLRHYFASVMLAGGTDIRALAEFLGHEDPGFTLRVYSHLMPASVSRARSAADAALSPSVPAVYRATL